MGNKSVVGYELSGDELILTYKDGDSAVFVKSERFWRYDDKRKEDWKEKNKERSGYFTDSRDGRRYRTVTIGGKTWMAQNLKYPIQNGSRCYNDSDPYCKKYGRMYAWDMAMKACPAGWRLPSRKEWDELGKAVGGKRRISHGDSIRGYGTDYVDWLGAGKKLKTRGGWGLYGTRNNGASGTDDFFFSAMSGGGFGRNGGNFFGIGADGNWWTATEHDGRNAYIRNISYAKDDLGESIDSKTVWLSVRCVLDTVGATALKAKDPPNKNVDSDTSSLMETKLSEEAIKRIKCEAEQRKKEAEQRFGKKIGYVTDSRDGNTYQTVKIGRQTWIAENMNYRTDNSWCYDNVDSNCVKYGRLYDWDAATTACPAGYRLASEYDWDTLVIAIGSQHKPYKGPADGWLGAGKALKAKRGWNNYKGKNGNGTDNFGFSALPGGSRDASGDFDGAGGYGYWWADRRFHGFSRKGAVWAINCTDGNAELYYGSTDDKDWVGGFYVRCVADGK
jgi:uncharacterized protein (TIGR02145 family)